MLGMLDDILMWCNQDIKSAIQMTEDRKMWRFVARRRRKGQRRRRKKKKKKKRS